MQAKNSLSHTGHVNGADLDKFIQDLVARRRLEYFVLLPGDFCDDVHLGNFADGPATQADLEVIRYLRRSFVGQQFDDLYSKVEKSTLGLICM